VHVDLDARAPDGLVDHLPQRLQVAQFGEHDALLRDLDDERHRVLEAVQQCVVQRENPRHGPILGVHGLLAIITFGSESSYPLYEGIRTKYTLPYATTGKMEIKIGRKKIIVICSIIAVTIAAILIVNSLVGSAPFYPRLFSSAIINNKTGIVVKVFEVEFNRESIKDTIAFFNFSKILLVVYNHTTNTNVMNKTIKSLIDNPISGVVFNDTDKSGSVSVGDTFSISADILRAAELVKFEHPEPYNGGEWSWPCWFANSYSI